MGFNGGLMGFKEIGHGFSAVSEGSAGSMAFLEAKIFSAKA